MTQDTQRTGTPRKAWWTLAVFVVATLAVGAAHHAQSTNTPNTTGGGNAATATGNGAISVSGTLDRTAVMLGDDGLVRMELVLAARQAQDGSVPALPTDLVVVLDRSGSMNGGEDPSTRARRSLPN